MAGATVTTAPEVTYNGSRSGVGAAFPPGNQVGVTNGYFGPNFQFTAPTNGVPEGGGTFLLLGAALVPLGACHFLRRPRCSAKN